MGRRRYPPGLGSGPPFAYGAHGSEASVAFDAQGDAVAVWVASRGQFTPASTIQTAFRPAGETWQEATTLSAEGQQANEPHVALDARGDATVLWSEGDAVHHVVQSAYRPAGGTWGAATNITAEGTQVAVDARGDALTVWEMRSGPNHIVQGAYRPAGGHWQAPERISALSPGVAAPALAMNARGEAIAVWNTGSLTGSAVQAAFWKPGKGWGRPKYLSGPNLSPTLPRVALDARGDAIVVWVRVSAGAYSNTVQAATRLSGRAWEGPHALSAPEQSAHEPDVAISNRGSAIVVWTLDRGKGRVVQSSVVSLASRRSKHSRSSAMTHR